LPASTPICVVCAHANIKTDKENAERNLATAEHNRLELQKGLSCIRDENNDLKRRVMDLEENLTSLRFSCDELKFRLKQTKSESNLLRLDLLKGSAFDGLRLIKQLRARFSWIPGVNMLLNKMESRIRHGRVQYIISKISESGLFDEEFYIGTYPDVSKSGINPLEHFVTCGVFEGRYPNSCFDPAYYIKKSTDVMAEGVNPLLHYELYGWKERRNPSPEFNTKYYLDSNPDVERVGLNPLKHYLFHGKQEERRICPPNDFQCKLLQRLNRESQSWILFVGHDGIKAGSETVLLEIVRWFFIHTRKRLKVLLLSPGILSDEYAKYADVFVLASPDDSASNNLIDFLA